MCLMDTLSSHSDPGRKALVSFMLFLVSFIDRETEAA